MKIENFKLKIVAALCLVLMIPSGSVFADTIIFTEGCTSAVGSSLATSTSISVGTSWSAKITLVGSPTALNYITAGDTLCSTNAAAADIGYGYTMTPSPSTGEYYADWSNVDGNPGANDGSGVLLNYIDTSNYYACVVNDDSGMDEYIIKVSSNVGSILGVASSTIGTASIVQCRIDYTGTNPVLSMTEDGVVIIASTTDSTSPLTRTRKAGFYCGATRGSLTHDCGTGADADTIRLVEVSATVPPVITTVAANANVSSALLNGTVTDSGSASSTTYGFAWGTSSTLTGSSVATTSNASVAIGTGDTFNQTVNTLKAGFTYYFRAYFTNSAGTGYGTILSFTTGTDTTLGRQMRLFEGFKVKLISNKIILRQM